MSIAVLTGRETGGRVLRPGEGISMINTRRVPSIRRAWVVVVVSTMAAMLWSSATAADARVLDRERYSFTSVAHERTCGRHLRVETTFSGIRMTKSTQQGAATLAFDNYNIHELLTEADGDGYIIDQAGLYSDLRASRVRGTLYRFTAINVGQVFTIRTLDGKAVERNRGLFEITFLMDTKGDSDPGNDVFFEDSVRLVRDAGKHPIVAQTDAEFCAVIDQAVQG